MNIIFVASIISIIVGFGFMLYGYKIHQNNQKSYKQLSVTPFNGLGVVFFVVALLFLVVGQLSIIG